MRTIRVAELHELVWEVQVRGNFFLKVSVNSALQLFGFENTVFFMNDDALTLEFYLQAEDFY